MSVLSVGMQGMQAGFNIADRAGGQILNASGSADADLAAPLIGLEIGKVQTEVSAQVVKTGDEMLGTLIDIQA